MKACGGPGAPHLLSLVRTTLGFQNVTFTEAKCDRVAYLLLNSWGLPLHLEWSPEVLVGSGTLFLA